VRNDRFNHPLNGPPRFLVGGPLGTVLLAAIAAGLLCFAAFRPVEAGLDLEDCGSGPQAAT